jgi:hypothetical protein
MDPQDIDLILVLAAGALGCVAPLVGRRTLAQPSGLLRELVVPARLERRFAEQPGFVFPACRWLARSRWSRRGVF